MSDPSTPDRLNELFIAEYDRVRRRLLARHRPVLFGTGDQLVLLREHERVERRMVWPPQVSDLKAMSHLPLTCYLLLGFEDGPALSPATRERAEDLRRRAAELLAGLPGRPLSPQQRDRQRTLVERCLAVLDGALARGTSAVDEAEALVRACRPLVDRNTEEAARALLGVLHHEIGGLYALLSPQEQRRLVVLNMGTKSARDGAQMLRYCAWLLGEEGEGTRIVFAEGARDEHHALEVLATFLVDLRIGQAHGGHPLAFMRDVLGDPTDALLQYRSPAELTALLNAAPP